MNEKPRFRIKSIMTKHGHEMTLCACAAEAGPCGGTRVARPDGLPPAKGVHAIEVVTMNDDSQWLKVTPCADDLDNIYINWPDAISMWEPLSEQ